MAKAKDHPDYDVSDNTYNLKRQGIKGKFWDTEIGDRRNKNKFVPRVKFTRWTDGFLEFGVPNGLLGGGDTVTHDGDAIVWSKGIYTAKFYDWTDDPDDPDGNGSFEWELILASEPPTNSLTLDLRRQNVVMYWQAPLTGQEITDGDERPERVEGSYAVYHTTKFGHKTGDINFEVGKIGHIYRPVATDDNGDTIWCDWNDDAESTGELTLTVDAAWLASAVYPVVIDPTFGFDTIAGSSEALNPTKNFALLGSLFRHTASSGDTVTAHDIYMKSGTADLNGTIEVGVYTVVTNEPAALLAAGGTDHTMSSTTPDWITVSGLSNSLVASSVYILAFSETDGNPRAHYDTTVADDRCQDNVSSGSGLAATWGHVSHSDRRYSVYATYTAGGGAARRVMVVS